MSVIADPEYIEELLFSIKNLNYRKKLENSVVMFNSKDNEFVCTRQDNGKISVHIISIRRGKLECDCNWYTMRIKSKNKTHRTCSHMLRLYYQLDPINFKRQVRLINMDYDERLVNKALP